MTTRSARTLGAFALGVWIAASGGSARAAEHTQNAPLPSQAVADDGEASVAPTEASALIYSVNRTAERAFETARAVQVITADDLWRRGARTLPEALMEEAGIFVQQTNYGGGSPIIRGLIGKQILILLDGVKVNTATYRFGPIQYLNTIDVGMVERIEVVRGVEPVLGGDALGGIINIITKKGPRRGAERLGAVLSSRFSTADRGLTGRAEVFGQGEKHRFMAGATYRDADDVKGGEGTGSQPNSGYDEWAGNASVEYFISKDRTLSLGFQRLEQDAVPRADPANLVYTFDPQVLQLLSLGFQDLTDRSWADSLQVTASWNRQEEGRQEVRTRTPTLQTSLDDRQDALGLNVEVGLFPHASHRVVYGLDYSHQKIHSTGANLDLISGLATPRRGTWTDGATYRAIGLYVQDRISIGKRLSLTLGGRYGRYSSAGTESSAVGQLDLESTQSDATGSVNTVVHLTSNLNLVGSVTRGFRAPNLDDTSVFSDRGREGVEVPNPDIQPERIRTYEAGLKFASAIFEGSAFYHDSSLTDLFVRAPGTLGGLPFFDLNGNGVRDATEALVLQRQNLGEARIHGVELTARWTPHPRVTLFGNYTYTVGDDESGGVPLGRIPPAFGSAGARWAGAAKLRPWAEVIYLLAAAQTRLSPTDIADLRIGPSGTAGFQVVHFRAGLNLSDLRLRMALENAANETYKYHGSGVFRPGRQLVFNAEYRF